MHLVRTMPGADPVAATNFLERNTDEDLQLFADPFVAAPVELERFREQRETTGAPVGASADWLTAERGFPSDGKRPVKTSHIIESTLVNAPEPARSGRRPSGSLWSYSSPLPAVKVNKTQPPAATTASVPDIQQRGRKGQFKAPPQKNGKQRPSDAYPSSSLWSYSEKKRMKGH